MAASAIFRNFDKNFTFVYGVIDQEKTKKEAGGFCKHS